MQCDKCDPGHYQNETGKTVCKECDKGMHISTFIPWPSFEIILVWLIYNIVGTHASVTGSSKCSNCETGTVCK